MSPVHYHEGRFPPDESLDWSSLDPLIGPATLALGRFDGLLSALLSPDLLLGPLTTQEAVLSSRIEGTQASLSDVLEFEAGGEAASPDHRNEIHEIINYRQAMRHAEELMKELPLCHRVIREAHRTLLSGVRGRDQLPGEFRKKQNWIGPPGIDIDAATFIPIRPEKLADAMNSWEKYIHEDARDRLVQLAVLHAEFEALHPFRDGNGRIGRMLVPLFLWTHGLIRRPTFYISAYFETRRDDYYEGLLSVSRDDDWTGWCCFFLKAVREQAEENERKANGILALYETMKPKIVELTRSRYATQALDWIFHYPIFNSGQFASNIGISRPTALRILDRLSQGGILRTIREGSGRQPTMLVFPDVLNVAEGRDIF